MLRVIRADGSLGDQFVKEESQLGQFIPLHYHYVMLQDQHRVQAFQAAIQQVVRPGMQVVELGGGTGILSSFAARSGGQVTTVERNPALAKSCRQFVEFNQLSEYIQVVEQEAQEYVPPQPVDVVICEMLHVGMLREKQLEVLEAFKQNYREAFGDEVALPSFLPEASILMIQPVQQSYDFSGYWAPVPLFQTTQSLTPDTLELAPLEPYATISYAQPYETKFDCCLDFVAESDGQFNAVRLITHNALAIDEPNQSATTWSNQALVMPLAQPVQGRAGETLRIEFAYHSGGNLEDLAATLEGSLTNQQQQQKSAA
jgi:predicted RNA methylase